MCSHASAFAQFSDADLLREVTRLAAYERNATARLIASLGALDVRRLYLSEGFSSLFAYCTEALRLSEHAAYDRITAARAARRFPVILERLADGSVTLTTVRLLAPHLTEANHAALLAEVRHRSKRDVEHLIALLHPRPDVPASVRKLPAPAPPPPPAGPATGAHANEPRGPAAPQSASLRVDTPQVPPAPPPRPAVVAPLAPARYKVSFTVGAETYAKLREVQDLLRHAVPDGDPAVIVDRALTALLTQLTKTKGAATDRLTRPPAARSRPPARDEGRPSPGRGPRSRRIPVAVQRAVWQRDGGQCTFVSRTGRRCPARGWLEFHHTVPFALGGETSVDNVRLLCRAHNQQQAARDFGPWDATRVREAAPSYGTTLAELVPARVGASSRGPATARSVRRRGRPSEPFRQHRLHVDERRIPVTSEFINSSVGHSPAVANRAIVKDCISVPGDVCTTHGGILVEALGSPTHVIIDVVGYFPF